MVFCTLVQDAASHKDLRRLLLLGARTCGRLLHRLLHCQCIGFCTAFLAPVQHRAFSTLSEGLIGDLKVVFVGDVGRVADPSTHHMNGILLGQLGLPACPQVLE